MKAEFTDSNGKVTLQPKAEKADLRNDVRHGYLTFIDDPDLPRVGTAVNYNTCFFDDGDFKSFDVGVDRHEVTDNDVGSHENGFLKQYLNSDDIRSLREANGLMEYDSSDVELFAAAKAWWATASNPSSSYDKYDRALISIGLEPKGAQSESPIEMPAWFALAAFHKAQVWVENMKEPISLVEAMRTPEWDKWKASIEKEVMGLIAMNLRDEVPRTSVPDGQRVNSGHFVFKIKTEDGKFVKCKSRYVFGGHRSVAGIDFMDIMAHMAALKSVRTVLALAAPAGHYLRNFDISQAFTFS